jgi:hypothetical protein
LAGFDQSVIVEQLLRLPDGVQAGHTVVLHQVADGREPVTGAELAGSDARLEVDGDIAVPCHIA